jgi:hypothetical protein
MKANFFLIIVITYALITSCKKTYICKDAYGNKTGEVKASSQDKANSMCPSDGHAEKK